MYLCLAVLPITPCKYSTMPGYIDTNIVYVNNVFLYIFNHCQEVRLSKDIIQYNIQYNINL